MFEVETHFFVAAENVQTGDVVLTSEGFVFEVEHVASFSGLNRVLVYRVRRPDESDEEYDSDPFVALELGRRIRLLHRLSPEGKTEEDMVNDVIVAMIDTGATRNREDFKRKLPALREAIEKWELGKKPPEPEQEK